MTIRTSFSGKFDTSCVFDSWHVDDADDDARINGNTAFGQSVKYGTYRGELFLDEISKTSRCSAQHRAFVDESEAISYSSHLNRSTVHEMKQQNPRNRR